MVLAAIIGKASTDTEVRKTTIMHQNEQKKIKVSVILPVWNPGPGISRCIESLRNQTLTDIEMIFVDDCGTDDSMNKVRAAAAEDNRIRIIYNEENIGAGHSRNKGIEAARGEYLSFVDPDDFVAADFLELLYREADNQAFDIVKGVRAYETENGLIKDRRKSLNQSIQRGVAKAEPLYLLFTFEHQSAIYRRELIIEKQVRYGSSSRSQDVTFLLQVCSQAKSISVVNEAYYFYCVRSNSAMHTLDNARMQGYLQSVHEKTDYVLKHLPKDKDSEAYLQGSFLAAIREGERYQDEPEAEDALKAYASELREELMRVPYCNELQSQSFALRALYEHCTLLPYTPFCYPWENNKPPVRYAKLAGRWVDYYISHPEEKSACTKILLLVLSHAKCAVKGKPITSFITDEMDKGKCILKEHINRLPLKIRLSLPLIYISVASANRLPNSTKETLKTLYKRLKM